MKFCIECGNQLSATNKFCTNCGTAVTRSGQENGATPIPNEENEIRNHTKQTEDVTPAKRSVKVVKKSTRITKWIIGAAVAIILIITGTVLAMGLNNGGDEKVAGTAAQTQKETTEKSEPELEK
ncbi:zinc-ribbon domain-containing protein [Ornithinibacillus halotolerans]|uniref:Zinc-ribbon domain-containing protein n=1 Tax=Ornithinibacillus halotolerans TaxID=1274357 RepID=A0A916S156_9BACI|nr:zinc-ribbon domain-containing protein [Ornithinibacillus halotolerans]GGA79805.1 hypothetical protein GCM10008025_24030 [Ornithinibacillus halotolerans]